ncbi:hypothetical protein Trydic_g12588 [Trypoxylus dichotomus]
MDMGLHISKIENIAHQLKTLKQVINENMIISKILSTLPAEYGHFLTAWESAATNEKTLEKLTARLLAEEAKQTRLPFKTSRQRASRCLEILHTDICGPIEPTTWDDKRYILTVLDDYTHYTRIYLLRYKNEAAEYLNEFIKEAEALQNIKVAKVRCDNGGIVLDFTRPYTPQLNGKAEKLNRTLLEKARALIFDAEISKEFWGEAAYLATYLLNRSPTEAEDKTPIECWTERKPVFSRLQIFGSTIYAKRVGYTQKLDSRSDKYIFVGYSLNGYRLWDKTSRKIIVSRDVVFTEPEQSANNSGIKEAINGPEKNQWIEVIPEEKESLCKNQTWIYVDKNEAILERFNMKNAKPVAMPMFSNDIGEDKKTSQRYPYREAVGSLPHLVNKTRLGILYAVNFCSRRMETPTEQDIVNVKRVFRYLVSTKIEGIGYNDSDCDKFVAFCDSGFAGDTETRKSTISYIIFLCGRPISRRSRKQPVVSLSSTESEYIAAAECVKELIYLKTIIDELTGGDIKIDMFMDNQSAITIVKNGQLSRVNT